MLYSTDKNCETAYSYVNLLFYFGSFSLISTLAWVFCATVHCSILVSSCLDLSHMLVIDASTRRVKKTTNHKQFFRLSSNKLNIFFLSWRKEIQPLKFDWFKQPINKNRRLLGLKCFVVCCDVSLMRKTKKCFGVSSLSHLYLMLF